MADMHRTDIDRTGIDRADTAPGCDAESRIRVAPGQATTEYALILLVAAVIAILVIGWATAGGGGGRIGGLFDGVLDMILRRAESSG